MSDQHVHWFAKLMFRGGFASIFFINAVVAVFEPESFKLLITENIVGQHLPEFLVEIMRWFIAVNDLFIGAVILSGKWRYFIYIWSGMWLVLIAGIKFTNLIW